MIRWKLKQAMLCGRRKYRNRNDIGLPYQKAIPCAAAIKMICVTETTVWK